jgi:hypothetical protein
VSDDPRAYVAGLAEASGTFSGTYDADSVPVRALLDAVPALMPVEIDTGDQPLPALEGLLPGAVLTVTMDGRTWKLPVDHAEVLAPDRVRIWVTRGGSQEVT